MCHYSCLCFMLMTLKVNDFNITAIFFYFVHDLINSYLKLVVLMYADGTIILCDSEGGMRQALIALNICNEWKAFLISISISVIIAVFLLRSCAPYFHFEVRAYK